jgi:hypothetical protein
VLQNGSGPLTIRLRSTISGNALSATRRSVRRRDLPMTWTRRIRMPVSTWSKATEYVVHSHHGSGPTLRGLSTDRLYDPIHALVPGTPIPPPLGARPAAGVTGVDHYLPRFFTSPLRPIRRPRVRPGSLRRPVCSMPVVDQVITADSGSARWCGW